MSDDEAGRILVFWWRVALTVGLFACAIALGRIADAQDRARPAPKDGGK